MTIDTIIHCYFHCRRRNRCRHFANISVAQQTFLCPANDVPSMGEVYVIRYVINLNPRNFPILRYVFEKHFLFLRIRYWFSGMTGLANFKRRKCRFRHCFNIRMAIFAACARLLDVNFMTKHNRLNNTSVLEMKHADERENEESCGGQRPNGSVFSKIFHTFGEKLQDELFRMITSFATAISCSPSEDTRTHCAFHRYRASAILCFAR